MSSPIMQWLKSDVPTPTLGAPGDASKPSLDVLYAFYLASFAPIRGYPQAPLVDFVEVLRQYDKTVIYSDEEWVPFFTQFTNGDVDAARDLWDGLVCQP